MRALHVADFSAPYPGAFIRQLRMLDAQLHTLGWEPTAFAFPERAMNTQWAHDLRATGHEVFPLPLASSRKQKHVAAALKNVVEETGATLVHSHFGTYDLSLTAAVRSIPAPARPRLFWHYRTALEEPVSERSLARRVKDWLKYRRAGRHVERCIAVTQALAEEVAQRGMGDRAEAVLAGCDTETFRPNAVARTRRREALHISDDQVLVLHMGWHWQRKGGDLLAAAARRLIERGYTNLVFGSIGADRGSVEAPVIRIEPTDAVYELHQASDIFVSASRSEGFGNGLVEAMSCGRVAVTALVEGQRETFEGTGDGCVIVPPEDAEALADGIERLLQARDNWDALGRSNREHVERSLSMARWARELSAIYDAGASSEREPLLRETA
jgi:glycosyltransferase involved in cell wall biosynthesis